MAIRLPEREGKPDSITGFYPIGFDDNFLGSASENSMAASPAGRHQHDLVIKLPVVTADGQRMAQEQLHVSIHTVVDSVHHQVA